MSAPTGPEPTSPEPVSALPDEDVLVIPDEWRKWAHPRRGGSHVPAVRVDGEAVRSLHALIESARPEIEAAIAHRGTAPELAARVRAHLDGAADPVGAAAVAKITSQGRATGEPGAEVLRTGFADAWIAAHGLTFAARTLIESCGVTCVGARKTAWLTWKEDKDDPAWSFAASTTWPWTEGGTARRVRTFLASATGDEYEEITGVLAGHRGSPARRQLASYLVPTRQDWVDECVAGCDSGLYRSGAVRRMLLCSLGSPGQVGRLGFSASIPEPGGRDTIATLVEAVGAEALPVLVQGLDHDHGNGALCRRLLEAVAMLPTDDAFQVLVARIDDREARPALVAAVERFPVRAMRLLAPVVTRSGNVPGGDAAALAMAGLLGGRLRSDPGLVAAALPGLPPDVRKVVEPLVAGPAPRPAAPAHALPRLLTEPPWTRARAKREPVLIGDLVPPAERVIAWEPGEREAWERKGQVDEWRWSRFDDATWDGLIDEYGEDRLADRRAAWLFTAGPLEKARPLVAGWEPYEPRQVAPWLPAIIARYELDARPVALDVVAWSPAHFADRLLPYRDAEVAAHMADWLTRLKGARQSARRWFRRHGTAAVPLLVPAAVGGAGPERRNAEGALRLLAADLGDEAVAKAAAAHGEGAARAVEALLAVDPLELLPARVPKAGAWADPAALPQVLLRDGASALPASATGHLLTMLAMSKPGEPYAGLGVVRELCDPVSLAEFAWAVFLRWEACGAPSKENWALVQLGVLGDDGTVRRLVPLIRALQGGHARAVRLLDVLAEIGSDVALLHLYGIARRVKYKGLKAKAQEKVDEIAAVRGLTADQLADRAVPDFGLDAEGGMVFDYGPRRFEVGFDEQLKPYAVTEDGRHRQSLPKPGAADDPTLAPAAHALFAGLKKDVKSVAEEQIRRLETAMVTGRRWTPDEFARLLVGHPLLWHMVRRLVWLAEDGDRATAFRIAEDRTFADVDDEAFTLPERARVGVVHPVRLGGALETWSELFADYEILQPFPQLGRAVHRLTEREGAGTRLERFEGLAVPYGRAKGFAQSRWLSDGERWIAVADPAGRHLVARFSPGLHHYYDGRGDDQTLESVWIGSRPAAEPDPADPLRLGDLDPVTASEAIADLLRLTRPD